MAGDPNLFDELLRAIADRRHSLPTDDADVTNVETWSAADRESLADLAADLDSLRAHKRPLGRVVSAEEPTRCAACEEPRPCSTISGLAEKYGVHGDPNAGGSPDAMTRSQMELDEVGQCLCGLHGRQDHHRVSGPGEEPEEFVRVGFHCPPTRPGPHIRID